MVCKNCRVRSSCQSTKMTVFFFSPYFALAKYKSAWQSIFSLSLPHKSHLSLPHLMRQSFDHHHFEKPQRATWQSINREFCRAKLGKHADACDSLRDFRQKIVAIHSPVIAASFAKQNLVSTQSVRLIASVAKQSSACTFSFSGLLRRFAPRNDKRINFSLAMSDE